MNNFENDSNVYNSENQYQNEQQGYNQQGYNQPEYGQYQSGQYQKSQDQYGQYDAIPRQNYDTQQYGNEQYGQYSVPQQNYGAEQYGQYSVPQQDYQTQQGYQTYDPTYAQQQYTQNPYVQNGQTYTQNNANQYPICQYPDNRYYGAVARPHFGFVQAVKAFFQNYVKFDGRASLSEYWWVSLFSFLVGIVIVILTYATGSIHTDPITHQVTYGPLYWILTLGWGLGTLLPSIGVAVRRLHDTNRSGWLYLLGLIPFVGTIILLVFFCLPSNPEGARFDGPVQPAIGQ